MTAERRRRRGVIAHQSGVVFLVAAVTVPFVLGAQKWKHMQGKRNPAFGLLLK